MNPLWNRMLLIIGALLLTGSLILYPQEVFEASIQGLNLWWEIVFPALLPFFIMSELLISLGAISIIGVLFEPIMRPLFNVPGAGSLALIMGLASGYPTGAKITAQLREENKISKTEAERLVSFTNASSPLFIFGAIAVGFFHDAKIGLLLAVCHYGGNILVGIILRFLYQEPKSSKGKHKKSSGSKWKQAITEMKSMSNFENKPLGEHLGNAVSNSVKTLIIIGGFITFFSVITNIFIQMNIVTLIANSFSFILSIASIPTEFALPLTIGLLEISIGTKYIASILSDGLLFPLIIVSFILGFHGFSIQAQVAAIISQTDIRFSRYFYARLIHAFIASALTVILYPIFYSSKGTNNVILPVFQEKIVHDIMLPIFQSLATFGPIITIMAISVALLYQIRR